jgi:predicted glycosyltransferase
MGTKRTKSENRDETLRIAVFTHDTFGLGHVRRSFHILRALAAAEPEAALLLVTGSPALHALGGLPRSADVVKIPTLARTGAPASRPPHLPLPVPHVTALRQRLVREALRGFRPHVFLVDNFPLGARRELRPILEELRAEPTRTVLGLRDVLDLPETVRTQWTRDGVYRVLEDCYDRILVYGSREILDAGEAYGLSASVRARLRHCGYVTGCDGAPAPEMRASRSRGGAVRVLATVGGGGDGLPLLRTFVAALPGLPNVSARVVTGPLMAPPERAELRRLAEGCSRLEIVDATPDLPAEMAASDLVVAMAGYNTVAELLALGRPAVLVPRTWRYGEHARGAEAGEEGEQLLRAQALERAGIATMLHPHDLSPEALGAKIREGLALRLPAAGGFDLGGLAQVTDELLAVAGRSRRVA